MAKVSERSDWRLLQKCHGARVELCDVWQVSSGERRQAYPCHFIKPCNNCSFLPRILLPSVLCRQITLRQLRQNCYLFHRTKKKRKEKEWSLVCRPGGCERDGARSCWRADWCPNRRWGYGESWRILYSYVHTPWQSSDLTVPRLTGLWLFPSHCC